MSNEYALSYIDQRTMSAKYEIARSSYLGGQSTPSPSHGENYNIQLLLDRHEGQLKLKAHIVPKNAVYVLPQFGNLPYERKAIKAIAATVTVKEMVQKLKTIFGLNNVQVASIIGVSRPSLYNHIAGKEAPKSLDSYQALYDIALKVETETNIPPKAGLKSVLVNGKTLLAYLKDHSSNPSEVISAAIEVAKKLEDSNTKNSSATKQRVASRMVTRAG